MHRTAPQQLPNLKCINGAQVMAFGRKERDYQFESQFLSPLPKNNDILKINF